MKYACIVLISLVTVWYQPCLAQKKSELKKHDLKGNVKSVKISKYKAVEKFGEPTKSDMTGELNMVFDLNGNLLEEQSSADGIRKIYLYDNGKLTTVISIKNSDTSRIAKITTDGKGNILEETYSDKEGKMLGKKINRYTQKGTSFLVTESEYNADGGERKKNINTYDNKGNLVNTSTEINQRETSHSYKYDAHGNCIQESLSYGGSELGATNFKYNSDGFVIESSTGTFEGLKKSVLYKYTKDNKGNYITKITSSGATYNGMNNKMEAQEIEERIIEYYN